MTSKLPPHVAPTILRTMGRLASSLGYDGTCGEVCDLISEYLSSLGIGHFIDWTGVYVSVWQADQHGLSIRRLRCLQALHREHTKRISTGTGSEFSCCSNNCCHSRSSSIISELRSCIKPGLLDDAIETGALSTDYLPYKIEQWLPKSLRWKPTKLHRFDAEAISKARKR